MGGFFSKVTDTLFGDSGKAASKSQERQNRANRQFIEEQVGRAREEVVPLFQGAQEARTAGSQAALDVLGGAVPSQLGAFQAGNVGAQQALTGGLPAFRQAILGLPQQALPQPTQIPVDTSFIPSQLPDLAPSQQRDGQSIVDALSGAGFFGGQRGGGATSGGGFFGTQRIADRTTDPSQERLQAILAGVRGFGGLSNFGF